MEKYMIPCMSKKLFGVECLGCGTQRSLALLLQGDFVAAFKMYPAIYTLILLFMFIFLHVIDKSRNYTKIVISLAIVNLIIMVVSYFYKMVY
ncbi:DUF2752 domain-containing protein [Flavobacterium sp. NRK F10]|uniref:DUF2752 domain-containing protein n=2 Tax=Flavobacterium sediminis TaxID=2201181 RepID=A0A2U8QZ54_9FLAO|nr:DUF2752 domain-containing protein [Flavobacterium sp. NRK F10]AWM15341.1 hypothetical protein DI487_12240 [Flavobacterium sediminis]MCO6175786.1 DUF2752 domain-containing protein [Flavobacterium sp. NRK F10]